MATAQQSPRFSSFNYRDAFSHSEQCDSVLSLTPAGGRKFCSERVTWVDRFDWTAPVKQLTDLFKHKNCRCWCHGALDNLIDPNADYALPEEYITSADRAFMLDEAAGVGVELTEFGAVPRTEAEDQGYGVTLDPDSAEWIFEPEAEPVLIASRTGFSNWAPDEFRRGKCSNCGDRFADCECVE